MTRTLSDLIQLYGRWAGPATRDAKRDLDKEHRDILNAALDRNAELAGQLLRAHYETTLSAVKNGGEVGLACLPHVKAAEIGGSCTSGSVTRPRLLDLRACLRHRPRKPGFRGQARDFRVRMCLFRKLVRKESMAWSAWPSPVPMLSWTQVK